MGGLRYRRCHRKNAAYVALDPQPLTLVRIARLANPARLPRVAEVIGRRAFADLAECQHRFDAWRVVYNTQRPHEALELATPAARYMPSPRPFRETIEPFDYGPGAIVRRVDEDGWLSFRNRPLKLGRAFAHHRIALRPANQEG